MTRYEVSEILTELYAQYTNSEPIYKHSFMIKGNKDYLFKFLKYLWKNHRKIYYRLAFWQTDKKSYSFKNAIHKDYGSHGYLSGFSDKPDYYYIYC